MLLFERLVVRNCGHMASSRAHVVRGPSAFSACETQQPTQRLDDEVPIHMASSRAWMVPRTRYIFYVRNPVAYSEAR